LGGGLGIHLYRWEWEYPGYNYGGTYWPGASVSESDSEFGFHVVGGAQFNLAPKWRLQIEAEYCAADMDQITLGANIIYQIGK
jgi:opacity protein-like surface antigen